MKHRKHWYRIYFGSCPACGSDKSYRVRIYGSKPKSPSKRYILMAERGITRMSEHRLTDEDLRKLANEREKELKALKDNQWSQ